MIDVYDLQDISFDTFLNEHVFKNKPCIIKNFANKDNCPLDKLKEHVETKSNRSSAVAIGNIYAYRSGYQDICKNHITNGLQGSNDVILRDDFRTWMHNKGNLTRWHYDGDGADLLNISIQGSKDFYLSPPGTLPVYPLSNIVWGIDFAEYIKVTISAGDMLFIPAYWFHKVITLEDGTLNMNYTFYNKHNSEIITKRDEDLYTLHRIFNSHMCLDDLTGEICRVIKVDDNIVRSLIRGMYETGVFYLVYCVIALILLYTSKRLNIVFNIAVVVFILFLIFYSKIEKATFGISRLVGIFLMIWLILLPIM